jgi:2-keto-4-pentenoate hydratase/2-oxohepta-3-ene-1,7-dioic acid hydratase in catechol pathway
MRLATVELEGGWVVAAVDGDLHLPLPAQDEELRSMRAIAAGENVVARARDWVSRQRRAGWLPIAAATFGPAVPDPPAIYTIGANYRSPADPGREPMERPMVLGKLPSSVVGHRATITWDRSVTANVDGECELGVVIGTPALDVGPARAMDHVFGYTIVDDLNSVDPWLDGANWLLGKSMAGFCPLGPWIVTADQLDPADLELGCTINGESIQAGRTSQMRHSIADVISYISRHVELRSGDVIATGTPARLATAPGPDRHLEPGDVVACWIEGIGELTNRIG